MRSSSSTRHPYISHSNDYVEGERRRNQKLYCWKHTHDKIVICCFALALPQALTRPFAVGSRHLGKHSRLILLGPDTFCVRVPVPSRNVAEIIHLGFNSCVGLRSEGDTLICRGYSNVGRRSLVLSHSSRFELADGTKSRITLLQLVCSGFRLVINSPNDVWYCSDCSAGPH